MYNVIKIKEQNKARASPGEREDNMKFYLKDIREEKEITVKSWNGSGYSPDCFGDLEVNFPAYHERVDGGDAYICTSEEYEELKDWWEEEIEAMNNGTQIHDTNYNEQPDENITIFAD